MAELIFEIGCEELPAGFVRPALEQLAALLDQALGAENLAHGPLETYGTPRRLGLLLRDLTEEQADRDEQVIGPKLDFCYKDGQPTKALLGFAASNKLELSQLSEIDGPKGRCVLAVKHIKGRQTKDLLPEILTTLVKKLSFRKSMRWAAHTESFARPVHWIVALFDGEVVPVTFAGVQSGATSYGHRFMAPEAIPVRHGESFLAHLEGAYVCYEQAKREALIREEATRLAATVGGVPLLGDELVAEVANLVEWPFGLLGHFDPAYLEVPKELLISTMAKNQRYFAVLDAAKGLMPYFITFANTRTEDAAVVVRGNERVIRARLSDARFYYDEDRKARLDSLLPKLAHVTFEERLGSYADKVARITEQVRFLASFTDVHDEAFAQALRAAELCKADLQTGVVYEFPELQGTIGRYYATRDGEEPSVCAACEEHYWPRYADDELPRGSVAALIALADKMDTLAGCFAVGLIPTGTADPYALRRQTLGILRILIARGWRVPLKAWAAFSVATLGAKCKRPATEIEADVLRFIEGRYRALRGKDYRPDLLDAVCGAGFDLLPECEGKLLALSQAAASPEFKDLAAAFKRVMNILKQRVSVVVDPDLFEHEAERRLWGNFQKTRDKAYSCLKAGDFKGAIEAFSELRPAVDGFFTDVMVMAEDPKKRDNRLALLGNLADAFTALADFRKIQTD